jgi:hypothetical protein
MKRDKTIFDDHLHIGNVPKPASSYILASSMVNDTNVLVMVYKLANASRVDVAWCP